MVNSAQFDNWMLAKRTLESSIRTTIRQIEIELCGKRGKYTNKTEKKTNPLHYALYGDITKLRTAAHYTKSINSAHHIHKSIKSEWFSLSVLFISRTLNFISKHLDAWSQVVVLLQTNARYGWKWTSKIMKRNLCGMNAKIIQSLWHHRKITKKKNFYNKLLKVNYHCIRNCIWTCGTR